MIGWPNHTIFHVGGTNQSWIQKISKDQDLAVYMLQINLPSTTTKMGVWGGICGYSSCSVGFPRFKILIYNE